MSKCEIILAALLVAPALCVAESVNVDIQGSANGGPGQDMNVGTYSGTAYAPDSGTHWNAFQFNNTLTPPLLDSQGNVTDIQMWFQGNPEEWSYGMGNALMDDYTYSNIALMGDNTGERFTIFSNLADGGSGLQVDGTQAFDIYIYTQGDKPGQLSSFQLKHAGGTEAQTSSGGGPFNGTYTEGGNVLKFANVVAKAYHISDTDHGYEFEFRWGHNGNGTAVINGIQILPVRKAAATGAATAAAAGGLIAISAAALLFVRPRRSE